MSGWLMYQPQARRSAQSPDTKALPVALSPAATIDPEQARAAYRRLVAEADRRESIAARVQESRSRVRLASAERSTSGELRLELQREEATLLLLHQGDVLARDPALRDSAAVAYRQAVELFPETSAAATARQRLDTLN
jgi:hypothetical protein